MAADRFELEQAIMNAWTTTDDITLLAENFSNGTLSEDEVANALLGLAALHTMRAAKVFDVFSEMLDDGQIE
jgi:hypothetical protein